jgi:1-acyl-sn-glycerol-3-phosphate acyltransferase
MIIRKLLGKMLFKLTGWTLSPEVPKEVFEKCVLIAAPHTSNWDYPYALGAMAMLNVKVRYTIKKEWMRFPFNLIFGPLGGIGIDRSPKEKGQERKGMVEAIADLFPQHEKLCVMVPAEGTRALRKQWKTGFYYIALAAKVPIVLGYLDYEKKVAGIGKAIYPTGDLDKDMREIMEFYKDIKGKHPAQFSLDERYWP